MAMETYFFQVWSICSKISVVSISLASATCERLRLTVVSADGCANERSSNSAMRSTDSANLWIARITAALNKKSKYGMDATRAVLLSSLTCQLHGPACSAVSPSIDVGSATSRK